MCDNNSSGAILCSRCVVWIWWLDQLCAVLSAKLTQSRETPLAAAASSCQLSQSDKMSVALFFAGIVVESQDRWMFRRPLPPSTSSSRQPHPGALEKCRVQGSPDQHCGQHTLMAKHTLAISNLVGYVGKRDDRAECGDEKKSLRPR